MRQPSGEPTDMFLTDGGLLVPAVTVGQMREIDRIAAENQTPSLSQMMENAGRSLATVTTTHLGEGWTEVPIAVLVGPGGNGGGGLVAARHLANRGGDVTVILSREPERDTIVNQQLGVYTETNGKQASSPGETGLILDALIGYGLDDAPRGKIAELIEAVNESGSDVVSLDVPSGVDADDGGRLGVAIVPDMTLTLALPKPGLSSNGTGNLWLADLGIPVGVLRRARFEPPPGLFEDGPIVHLSRRTS